MKNWSLKWQIIALVVSLVTVTVAALTALTITQIDRRLTDSLERKVVNLSSLLADNAGVGLEFRDSVYVEEIARGAFTDSDLIGFSLYDGNGILYHEQSTYPGVFPSYDSCNQVSEIEITHTGDRLTIERPVYAKGKLVGCLWLVLTKKPLNAEVRDSIVIVLTMAALLIVLSAVIGIVMSRRVVKPIKTFEQAAMRISSGDMMSSIDPTVLHRDFLRLGTSFNQMQDALQSAFHEVNKSRDRLEDQVEVRTSELREELSERRRAEAALREGQALLSATLESTADGILVVNAEGKATHANALFAKMWRTPEEILSTHDDNLLLAHVLDQLVDHEAFLSKVRELYASHDTSVDTLLFKDGRLFERFSCPLLQDGVVTGRVWSFRDITERKRAEEEVQTLASVIRHSQELVNLSTTDGRMTFLNEAGAKMLGIDPKDVERTNIMQVIPDHLKAKLENDLVPRLMAGGFWTGELQYRNLKTGELVDVYAQTFVIMDSSGRTPQYFANVSLNITERRRTEQAQNVLLRVSEMASQTENLESLLKVVQQQLGTLIDTRNFFVALYDPATGFYSFPYSQDEHPDEDFSPQRLEGGLTDYILRVGEPMLVDEKMHQELNERGETKLLGSPACLWLGVPLRTAVGTIGVLVVQNYHDPNAYDQSDVDLLRSVADPIARVIERVRAEEQHHKLQDELERAERMRSLGVLAGGVAHDLNNMLGPLVGYPELILMRLPEDSPVRKQVQRIGNAAKDAADVVQDLLTLARRGRYEMVPTDLNAVVDAYLDSPSFARLSEVRANVTITHQLDENLGLIMGSAPHLSKVVMNLIVNAFDAMPEGGELRITTVQRNVTVLPGGYQGIIPGEYVTLSIKDTGTGIDPADIEKIFEPYFSKKKMGTSGSGLGLSVVYGVVKDHKGYYDILSEIGKGTEFILYFPLTEITAKVQHQSSQELRGNESVLVVDDDSSQREMAVELLESLGYRVTSAANGHEALDCLKKQPVDIVMLDMIMEENFDGLDTYREILKISPTQKAIVVSGFSSTDRVQEMQKLGAGQYVKKPYTQTMLASALRTELDRTEITSVARTAVASVDE